MSRKISYVLVLGKLIVMSIERRVFGNYWEKTVVIIGKYDCFIAWRLRESDKLK